MPVTEESRHRLHQALDTAIGPEEATTLMEHLPPTGWSDIATKQDIVLVRQDLTALEERLEAKVGSLRTEDLALVRKDLAAADTKIDAVADRLDTKIDHRSQMLEDKIDNNLAIDGQRFAAMNERLEKLEILIGGVAHQVTKLGERMDRSDQRYQQLVTRVDRQFWQFIGLILAITAIIWAVAGGG